MNCYARMCVCVFVPGFGKMKPIHKIKSLIRCFFWHTDFILYFSEEIPPNIYCSVSLYES